ncbi:MAG TPA: hypothetical protein VFD78_04585 [Chitinophagaceae bacterium]|nr:hypothetical protein [Chitinophagaceae bacterium]
MSLKYYKILTLTIAVIFINSVLFGQELMRGKIVLIETDEPIEQVTILNSTTDDVYFSDADGSFEFEVQPNDVIEFRKMGFKSERVVIRQGPIPYYHVALQPGSIELSTVFIKGNSYREDSIQMAKVFDYALRQPKRSDINVLSNPFALLDPRARQIWRFQRMFHYFESEKYIDYVFNDELIYRINPDFDEEYLAEYMRKYRPSYEQIQAWTSYEYLEYVKRTSSLYLKNK